MLKSMLAFLSICYMLASVVAQDPFYIDDENDFDIEFIDFPNNSIPDFLLELSDPDLSNNSIPTLEPPPSMSVHRAFKGINPEPDVKEIIEQQSDFGIETHAFPCAIVDGCVNVINGTYVELTKDFSFPGSVPLEMQRSYHSGTCKKNLLLYGWQLNHGGQLFTWMKHNHLHAVIKGGDRQGAHYKEEWDPNYLSCPHYFFNKWVTNCALGQINAFTHLKNDYLVDHIETMDLFTAGWFNSCYKKCGSKHGVKFFHLETNQLPNGNYFNYHYHSRFAMPTCIALHNSEGDNIANIELEDIPNKYEFTRNPEFTFLTPSGEELSYRFELYKNDNRAILSEVISPHAPKIKYSYFPFREHEKKPKLYKRELPDQRILEIEYYDDGRIYQLFSPCGDNNNFMATHTFHYYDDLNNACAVVRNAIGGVKKYLWDRESKRLHSITTYKRYQYCNQKDCYDSEGQDALLKEYFDWGKGPFNQGDLKARLLETGFGQMIAFQEYEYDIDGNILRSLLYGNLTGRHATSIYLKSLTSPPSTYCDVYQIDYTYDLEKRRKSENNGRALHTYRYLGRTNLISAHYTSYEGRIQIRRFYEYDASGAISKEIIDDGSANSAHDLTNVTERLIKHIENTPMGLPKITRDYALDIKSGTTQFLRETVNDYTPQGWLASQSIFDSNKKLAYTLEWKYDSHGNVIYEKNALGHVTHARYDDNDNLIYEAKPDLAPRTLIYDHMNRLIGETLDSGSESLHKSYRYDEMGNRTLSVDIYGRETHYSYDPHGRLEKIIYPALDEIKPTYTYKRNAQGFATLITDARGNQTRITYNIRGKPLCITYPDSTSESRLYTLWGELAESISSDGTKTLYTYDALGRETKKEWFDAQGNRIKETSKSYNAFHLMSEIDANGNTTEYTYDSAGRLASKKIKRRLTTYTYDDLGRLTTTSHGLKDNKKISYVEELDLLGQVIKSYTICPNGEIIQRVTRRYDAQGNEIRRKERNQAGAAYTLRSYDLFGREKSVTNPLGEITRTFYPQDKDILHVEVVDPRGTKMSYTYDFFGHPLLEQCYNAMGQLESEIKFGYDLEGNKILRRVKTDKGAIKTRWRYNAVNQLTKTVEAAGTEDQKIVRREYNRAGQLEKIIKNDGIALTYEYDALGRKISLTSSDGKLDYAYQYDKNDNLLLAEDKVNHTALICSYTGHNELETETLPFGHKLSYKYDLLGNVKRVTLPDQTKICYLYEGNRLETIKRQGAHSYSHTYEKYDHSSNPTQICLADNAGTLKIDYDLLHRATHIDSPAWEENLRYGVQLLDKRTLRDDVGKAASSYTYDARKQLLTENGLAENRFEYDWHGNIQGHNGHYRHHNARNALVSHRKKDYTYDLNGNRISDGVNTYQYDPLDRLVKAETPSGTYEYTYDAIGRRILSSHRKERTYYLWQKQDEIGTISAKGEIQELQVLDSTSRPVAFELQGSLYIPITDVFGHIRNLLDSAGNCIATYRYSAFGKEETHGRVLSPWRYAGKRIDAETGLIYFGNRYYDPRTLCWLTPDPLEDIDGPNHYAYVRNNPLYYIDPDGCEPFTLTVCAITWGCGVTLGWVTGETLLYTAAIGLATYAGYEVGKILNRNAHYKENEEEKEKKELEDEKDKSKDGPSYNGRKYNGKELGSDPAKCPGEGYEWRGKDDPGGKRGAWHDPETKESLHPDLDHPPPIEPHWDYRRPDGRRARLNLDGTWDWNDSRNKKN